MRVLVVAPNMYIYGGAELVVVELLNYMADNGIEHALLCTGLLPEIEKALIATEIINYPFAASNDWRDLLQNMWLLSKGVARHAKRFDIINFHNCPAEIAALAASKPSVWLCNEPPEVFLGGSHARDSAPKRLAKSIFYALDKLIVRRFVRNVVVADDFNAMRFKSLYGMTPQIIPYGINYDFFSTAPELIPKNEGRFVVFQSGMFNPYKNQLKTLQTVASLRDKIPEIQLILAGFQGGPYFEEVKKYINEHRLDDIVSLTGHINRADLRQLYYAADMLIHPVKSQGGWLSPFEALSAETPVVVSTEMTAASLIQSNAIGTVTADYAKAVMDVYLNRQRHKEAARRGRQFVKDNLTWEQFGAKMLTAFDNAMRRA
ncbi:MAG: glycosyltransferase family 4 protein [Candidatus Magnetominusculus sp. LBB02]|nr:glycosyltransferase family 4 protein [Candidatus Magnetominusculus sp. LBB02]